MAEFDYDHAGNRKTAKESGCGRASGGNDFHPMLTANYPANALDPYSRIASPRLFDVPGSRAVGGVGGRCEYQHRFTEYGQPGRRRLPAKRRQLLHLTHSPQHWHLRQRPGDRKRFLGHREPISLSPREFPARFTRPADDFKKPPKREFIKLF